MGYIPKIDSRPNLAFGILETRRKRHELGQSPGDVLAAVEVARAARAARLGHRRTIAPAPAAKGRGKRAEGASE